MSQSDNGNLIISLLSNRIYQTNNYDNELFAYCQKIGLDRDIIYAIYLAEHKEIISAILEKNLPDNFGALLPIMRLKKLSASQRFNKNYGAYAN